jgi:hypothetical protein
VATVKLLKKLLTRDFATKPRSISKIEQQPVELNVMKRLSSVEASLLAIVNPKGKERLLAVGETTLLENTKSQFGIDPMAVSRIETASHATATKQREGRFTNEVASANQASPADGPSILDQVTVEIIPYVLEFRALINNLCGGGGQDNLRLIIEHRYESTEAVPTHEFVIRKDELDILTASLAEAPIQMSNHAEIGRVSGNTNPRIAARILVNNLQRMIR